jgi:phytoene desaturase
MMPWARWSSAAASAAWPPCAWRGFGGLAAAVRLAAAGASRCWKSSTPGGRAYVHREDGYTFDAGPTIVTAPHLFDELWALCGRRLADDVTLRAARPVLPHPLRRRHHFDYSGDRTACAPRWPHQPGRRAGYERFMAEAERCYRSASRNSAPPPFDTWATCCRAPCPR